MKKESKGLISILFAISLILASFIFLLINGSQVSKIQGKVIYYNADNEICNRIYNSCQRTEIYKEKDLQLKYKESNCNKIGINFIKQICFNIFGPKRISSDSDCKEILNQCKERFDYNSYNISNSKLLCNKINENCLRNIEIYKNFNYTCKTITDNKTKSACYSEATTQSDNLRYRCTIIKINCYNKLNLIINNQNTTKIEEIFKAMEDYSNELAEDNLNSSQKQDLEEYSANIYNEEMGYETIVDDRFSEQSPPKTEENADSNENTDSDTMTNPVDYSPDQDTSQTETSTDQGIYTEPAITSSINLTNSTDICNLIVNISVKNICLNAVKEKESGSETGAESWCDKIENVNSKQTCYFATRVQKNTLTNTGSQRDLSLCDDYKDLTLKNLCAKYVNAKTH